jgi:hypothetical protein
MIRDVKKELDAVFEFCDPDGSQRVSRAFIEALISSAVEKMKLPLNGPSSEVHVTGHRVIIPEIPCDHSVERATITLRQIGWVDQKGVVYSISKLPPSSEFRGGSLTPLYINPGCD